MFAGVYFAGAMMGQAEVQTVIVTTSKGKPTIGTPPTIKVAINP